MLVRDILNRSFTVGSNEFHLADLLMGLAVIVFGVVFLWVFTRFILTPYLRRREVDEGREFSIVQLVKYVFYVVIVLAGVQTAGIHLTILLAAGAAMLVGVGIGLQQTFNDFVSGIILLAEGTIQKGDWLQLPEDEAKVLKIGPRASLLEARSGIKMIVPNSKITVDTVINLSHDNDFIRYSLDVGVAYGSDTRLVESILLKCADGHEDVMKKPKPFVRFEDFGDSALHFQLFFWSQEFRAIEFVYSDLRFVIDSEFRKAGITIPFPQRTLHIQSGLNSGSRESNS